MGGTESTFNTLLLQEGNVEEQALKIWLQDQQLRESFQQRPNLPLKSSPCRDTPLHCAARKEMKILMLEFLEKGADPLARNSNSETPIHIVCTSARASSRTSKRRYDMLQLLLEKVPEVCGEESYDIIKSESSPCVEESGVQNGVPYSVNMNLGSPDKSQNTPLHLAAASGLLSCVELLLVHGAPLFAYNVANQTPCDVAGEAKHLLIAKQLESKMVLSSNPTEGSVVQPIARSRNRSFHTTRTLKNLKEEIIQSVSERLNIAQFPAKALLMAYGWSEELVVQMWGEDKKAASEKAGIDLEYLEEEEEEGSLKYTSFTLHQCGVCYDEIPLESKVSIPCGHYFCQECWKSYLLGQINEGAGKEIRCPGHQCHKVVPDDVLQRLVTKEVYDKYSQLNVQQFVDSYSDVKWCPFPNCGLAVGLKEVGGAKSEDVVKRKRGGVGDHQRLNVECEQGHGFCWNCNQEPHDPCHCELWEKWKAAILKLGGGLDRSRVTEEAVANARWIISFTKPCPHCKAPIQKTEGCNHMTCKKCQYDFCWVCLDPWSLHNNKTGGYFTCNRYKAAQAAQQVVSKARQTMEQDYVRRAEEEFRERKEKFLHYYARYSNHLNSLQIELKTLQESQAKAEQLAKMGQVLEKKVATLRARALLVYGQESPPVEPKHEASAVATAEQNFLDGIIRVLLNSRRILSASYCLGYFIPEERKEVNQAHETLQGKLEEAVERLSQMVNRPYLRTPQPKMSEAARDVDYLCEEYLKEMSLVADVALEAERRPPTPPPPPPEQSPPPEESHPRRRVPHRLFTGFVDSLELYL